MLTCGVWCRRLCRSSRLSSVAPRVTRAATTVCLGLRQSHAPCTKHATSHSNATPNRSTLASHPHATPPRPTRVADPDRLAFGGGSFGGVCALYAAMHYPHVFGSILAESPSLWIARGRFLSDLRNHAGPWAQRVFIVGGTLEFSATRPDCVRPDVDHLLLHYLREANDILRSKVGTTGGTVSVHACRAGPLFSHIVKFCSACCH